MHFNEAIYIVIGGRMKFNILFNRRDIRLTYINPLCIVCD